MQGLLFLNRREAMSAHKGCRASCSSTDERPNLHTKEAGPLFPRQMRDYACTKRMTGFLILDRQEVIPAYKECRAFCSFTDKRSHLHTKNAGPLVPRQARGHTCIQRMQGLLFLDRREAMPAHKGCRASCSSTDERP